MDIILTDGDDNYVQSAATIDQWNGYFGKGGNDIIKVYQGGVLGGPGNDRIEKLPSADVWRTIAANYWESPGYVTVDLAAGWAEDGYGTRDTLIGVQHVNGGWNGSTIRGDALDNHISIGGGDNTVDGRGGDDRLVLPVFDDQTDIKLFNITASIDGLSALITHASNPYFKAVVSNVEWITVGWNNVMYSIADFIKPEDMALQGLLAGDANRWNAGSAMGSAVQISFSFMAQAPAGAGVTGFAAIAEAQRPLFRTILDSVARLTGATFLEVADSAASNLRFGASQQSATKGLSAMPGETNAGQVWMDIESLLLLTPGSEGYAALLHEIGHALGLRHPRNVEAGDKYTAQWRPEDDQTSLSVMSQNASPDGLFPSTWSAYDITALRALYGSGAQANPGDTRYELGAREFTAQTAIADDAGIDTIDARLSVTGVAIDLAPGHVSSVGVSAAGIGAVENLSLATSAWIENASGSAFDDVIKGNALDNILTGGKGNDWLDGGAGIDTASFAGKRGDYLVSSGFGKLFVTARDGVSGFDTLLGIEKLQFADGAVVLGSSAFGADLAIEVDQNASVAGVLPEPSDSKAADVSYAVAKGPANGALALAANGSYTYTPRPGFSSSDSFSYTLADKNGGSNVYTGYVTVRAISATISGGGGDDSLAGTAANDVIDAGAGNDRITGSAGSDGINGGAGLDTLVFSQARAGFSFTRADSGVVSLAKPAGFDTLDGVERVRFSDGAVALDVDGAAGQTYRIYQAAFNRTPDKGGLGYWISRMDGGTGGAEVAAGFMASDEFTAIYGKAPSAEVFVAKLYDNVLHRAYDQAGFDYWVGIIKNGYSRPLVLLEFAEGAENKAALIGVQQLGMEYTPYG